MYVCLPDLPRFTSKKIFFDKTPCAHLRASAYTTRVMYQDITHQHLVSPFSAYFMFSSADEMTDDQCFIDGVNLEGNSSAVSGFEFTELFILSQEQ